MPLPKSTSLRLQSDIEQSDAAILDKANSLKRGCASFRKELRKAKACKNPTERAEKQKFLEVKLQALEKEHEQFLGEQSRQINLLKKDLHEKQERMRGLLAYGLATGGLCPDATLLFNTLGDLLGAKTEGDRASANKAVNLILEHGNIFGKEEDTGAYDDEALRRFESLSDSEQRSAFYNKNRDAIHRAFEARKNNP